MVSPAGTRPISNQLGGSEGVSSSSWVGHRAREVSKPEPVATTPAVRPPAVFLAVRRAMRVAVEVAGSCMRAAGDKPPPGGGNKTDHPPSRLTSAVFRNSSVMIPLPRLEDSEAARGTAADSGFRRLRRCGVAEAWYLQ